MPLRRKFRILMVVPYFYPAWAYGGIPRLAYGLARALAKRGNWVEVVTTDAFTRHSRHPHSGHTLMVDGIRVTYLPNLSNALAYRQLFLPKSFLNVFGERLRRVEILHIHGHRNLMELIASFVSETKNVPRVFTPNGTLPNIDTKIIFKFFYDLFFGKRTLNLINHFVAVSETERELMLQYGIEPERISVIPNGIDFSEFSWHPAAGEFRAAWGLGKRKVVLYMGRISPRKRIDVLVRAFSKAGASEARLVIAGNDMGGLKKVKQEIKKQKFSHRVLLTGLLTGRERLSALRDAHVTVYAGKDEIFGLVPFEALLCKTPVIISSDSGAAEIIPKCAVATKIHSKDKNALLEALKYWLKKEKPPPPFFRRTINKIKKELGWNKIAQLTEKAYLKALG